MIRFYRDVLGFEIKEAVNLGDSALVIFPTHKAT